jgi:hypothetical protein
MAWETPARRSCLTRPTLSGIESALRLVDSKISTHRVSMGTYEPAGDFVTGSFLGQPR